MSWYKTGMWNHYIYKITQHVCPLFKHYTHFRSNLRPDCNSTRGFPESPQSQKMMVKCPWFQVWEVQTSPGLQRSEWTPEFQNTCSSFRCVSYQSEKHSYSTQSKKRILLMRQHSVYTGKGDVTCFCHTAIRLHLCRNISLHFTSIPPLLGFKMHHHSITLTQSRNVQDFI